MDTDTLEMATPGLRAALLSIARKYEQLGAEAAATAPYWEPCPSNVISFRAVAEVLRSEVEGL